MRVLNLALALTIVFGGSLLLLDSCAKEEPQSISTAPGELDLCAKCGQFKGGLACCKEGAAKCSACGLDKGSPGCCKLPKETSN